jgi:hypothetical protein
MLAKIRGSVSEILNAPILFRAKVSGIQLEMQTLEQNMQRYTTQLLTDLETAIRNAPASSNYRFRFPFSNDDEGEDQHYQLRYIRLNELFGLPPGIFPPSERLTKTQLTALLTAIEGLWRAWAIRWDCPPRLTARRRYTVMVEMMELDPLPYNYELGATINFCARRAENQCPFSDRSQCWCDEMDACVQHDLDIFENSTEFQDIERPGKAPMEELRQWLDDGKPELPPWEIDETPDQWKDLLQDEDSFSWLFFYDPRRNQEPVDEADQVHSPEDYEDFEWHSEDEDEFDDLPF